MMKNDDLTPMMRQYNRFKEQYPGKILFFRMGDFYEMFGDDALEAAPILGIALTSRSADKGKAVPLCGIPYHAIDKYLPRLIEAGKKVVICEQVEDPKTAKGIVKRDVVEIVTPGTTTAETALIPSDNAYLVALCGTKEKMGLARLELSTGEFIVTENNSNAVYDQLLLVRPREILFPADDAGAKIYPSASDSAGWVMTPLEAIYFDRRLGEERLQRFFGVSTLDGFGLGGMTDAVAAAGAILRYLHDNKQDRLQHITAITAGRPDHRMLLDAATVRNLELFANPASGGEKHSLFWAVNRTGSAAGARRLRRALAAPFIEAKSINARLDAVAELFTATDLAHDLAEHFKHFPDLERLSGRVGMGKSTARTLLSIRDAVVIAAQIQISLKAVQSPLLRAVYKSLPDLTSMAEMIAQAVREDAPLAISGGGLIREGYSAELDALNGSIKDARAWIAGLTRSERDRTGIPSLKVGFNKIFGYYIEVTRTHSDKVPSDYIRKQTLVNAERYITEEMKQKESLILDAEEHINRLEETLFRDLAEKVAIQLPALLALADALAEVDLINSLAILAGQEKYVRPVITEGKALQITGGRHPVISQIVGPGNFTPNDLTFDDASSMVILTGPNMSGKSTWLRQAGLLVILVQIGSFIPADAAQMGIVDRVFTRVGATDNLTRGQSTFLVEMVETANILHNKTDRSLVLLDEVGRGTSTFDGLSVAWAVAETIYQHSGGTPRTLFATHYHEMTGLAGIYPRIKNFQVAVRKWGQEVIFLHQVVPGGCDDSYGIEVARLAGLPKATIKRAHEILRLLESGKFAKSELAQGVHVRLNQPTLFDESAAKVTSEIENKIANLDLNQITPLQALEILAGLKKDVERD